MYYHQHPSRNRRISISTFTTLTKKVGGSYENKSVRWGEISSRIQKTLITRLDTEQIMTWCLYDATCMAWHVVHACWQDWSKDVRGWGDVKRVLCSRSFLTVFCSRLLLTVFFSSKLLLKVSLWPSHLLWKPLLCLDLLPSCMLLSNPNFSSLVLLSLVSDISVSPMSILRPRSMIID